MASATRVKIPKATLIKELEKEQEKAEKKFVADLEKWEQEKATYNERLASGLEKEAARVRKMNGKPGEWLRAEGRMMPREILGWVVIAL